MFINNLNLKTKLLLIMLFLSLLSIGSLYLLYNRAENALINEVERYTDDLSAALQISMEQLTKEGEEVKDESLKEYVQRLRKKGVKDISILDNDMEVVASSNPAFIGKELNIKGKALKTSSNVKEYQSAVSGQRNYDILLPVIVGSEQLGYVHVAIIFDDFAELLRKNHLNRLLATIIVFTLGISVSTFLAVKYTRPISELERAARRVASGDLSENLEVKEKDEVGELTLSFNEMVKGLRERKEMEERLQRSEHFSRIGQLASGIAHEVRNPLNLVNLSIDHLKARYSPTAPRDRDEFAGILSSIKGEVQRLNTLMNNFLEYGKPLKLALEPTSLAGIVEDVLELANEKLIEQKIEVEKMFSGTPEILVDRRQIKTCILNIVLNAIQAMHQGGKLTVKTSLIGGIASLAIGDTGVGIPPEDIHKVFEPYFTTKDAGIGLGLALTKRIVDEHGGHLKIESGGSGTVVSMELPVEREA